MGKKLFFRLNNQIRASELRVLDNSGKQIGVLNLSDALKKANEEGLDLIEIAPNAKPPVAKIADFGKFKYQEEKKLKKASKKNKTGDLKEVRFSPFIGEHDYKTRLEKITEFLDDNNKVRLVVVFKGRQMGSKKFGYELLKKVLSEYEERIAVDMEPKFIGRFLSMIISPVKKKK